MKRNFSVAFILFLSAFLSIAQSKGNSFSLNASEGDIVMTWNKDTPEQEMKDDIMAMAVHGVTVKYANVKRNDKKEITSIDVSFDATNGTKGSMSFNNRKPIGTIKIYKQDGEVGFGEPAGMMNPFMSGFAGNNNMLRNFNFNFDPDNLGSEKFEFKMPGGESFSKGKSKIIIKKDGKKTLIIEDGEVIEGGEDYTAEEIEEIKKNNKIGVEKEGSIPFFDFRNNNLSEQMRKMQEQIDELSRKLNMPEDKDADASKKDSKKSKEDTNDEKKEVKKGKTSLSVKKA
jgi:hypothetical protein